MMNLLSATIRQPKGMLVALVFPLGIWGVLWLSIAGEYPNISAIAQAQNTQEFARGIAAVVPFAAAGVAMAIILYRVGASSRIRVLFLGPLGLATIYGSVGVLSALYSPDGSMALYWAATYLTVPIILWSITLVGDTAEQLRLIIILTWIVFAVAVVLLLAFGLIKLDLWNVVTHPGSWSKCTPQGWYAATSHLIRETGVGRYAAIAGIVSLSGLWQRNWRFFWAAIFLISMFMLLTSGARTSMAGFLLGAPVVILLQGGKKAAAGGVVAVALLIPLFWSTGIHQTFLDNCIWRLLPPSATDAVQQPDRFFDSLTTVTLTNAGGPLIVASVVNIPAKPLPGSTSEDLAQSAPNDTADDPAQSIPDDDDDELAQSIPDATADDPAQSVPDDDDDELAQSVPDATAGRILGQIPKNYLKLNGRTAIWAEAWGFIKDSPLLGYGFHADRLLIGQHTHNAYLHALLQTGFIGGVVFMAALLFTLVHLAGIIRDLNRFSTAHKQLLIGTAGILAFLSVRMITESTGAFFGVDWLLLAPLLLYVQIMNQSPISGQQTA